MSAQTAATEVRAPTAPRRGSKRFTRKQRVVITVVNLATFGIVWQVAPVILDLPPLFLPQLTDVLAEIPATHEQGILVENVLISLRIYLLGIGFAITSAIPLGLLLGGVKVLDRIISPYVWVIYTTPLIIIMPLVLLWVGINNTAAVLLVFISAFPAILVVVMEGVKTVDNSLLQAARSFGAGKLRLFTRVIFPSTIPFIATGVKMGVARGLIGLFVAELFTSGEGIGYVIELASKTFNVARVYAMLLLFVVFSLAMVGLGQYAERRLSVWRSSTL